MILVSPCSVTIDVNSGNTGIFCHSLFLTDGKKGFGHRPLPVFVHFCCHKLSPFSLTLIIITSLHILSYATGSSSTAAAFASLSTISFPSIHECHIIQPKCIIHYTYIPTYVTPWSTILSEKPAKFTAS
jgi:hypothetical protein